MRCIISESESRKFNQTKSWPDAIVDNDNDDAESELEVPTAFQVPNDKFQSNIIDNQRCQNNN